MPAFPKSEGDMASRGEVSKGPSTWLVRVRASKQKISHPLCQRFPAVGHRTKNEKLQRVGQTMRPQSAKEQRRSPTSSGRQLDMHSYPERGVARA